MAEIQGTHRRELEAKSVDAEIKHLERTDSEARWGQLFAFIITIILIVAGTYVILNGHEISGTILGGLGLSGIITAFIYGRTRDEVGEDKSS